MPKKRSLLLLAALLPMLASAQCSDTLTVVLYPDSGSGDYTWSQLVYPSVLDYCNLPTPASSTNDAHFQVGVWHASGHCNCYITGCAWARQRAGMNFNHSIPANATVLSANLHLEDKGTGSLIGDMLLNGTQVVAGNTQTINEDVTAMVQSMLGSGSALGFSLQAQQEDDNQQLKYLHSTESANMSQWPSLTVSFVTTEILTATTSTSSNCAPPFSGTASVSPSNGTAPFDYTWNAQAGGQSTATATGLQAGSYLCTVSDANGCTGVAQATVDMLPSATLGISVTSAVSCIPGGDGVATAIASGGSAPYTYAWLNGGTTQTGSTATGLSAGYAHVTVTDAGGCATQASTYLWSPAPNANAISTIAATCGHSNGSILLEGNNAYTPWQYSWDVAAGSQSTDLATGLAPGTYSVTVTNSLGCTQQQSFTATGTPGPEAFASATETACGASNGSITITPANGTPPYTYGWDNNAGIGPLATGLGLGMYGLTMTDAEGCSTTVQTAINEIGLGGLQTIVANDGVAHDVDIKHDVDNWGTPFIVVTRHATTLRYGEIFFPDVYYRSYLSFGQTLSAGTLDSAKLVLTGAVKSIACLPLWGGLDEATVNNNTVPSQLTGFGSITNSTYVNGERTFDVTAALQHMINNNQEPTFRFTGITINGGTATFASSENSNTASRPRLEVYYSSTPSTISTASTAASCNTSNGTATANITGGVTATGWQWDANANNQSSQTATGLAAGNYVVTMTDNTGCGVVELVNVPGNTLAISTSSTANTAAPNNGTATAHATGGVLPYTYQWDASASSQVTATASGLGSGTYMVSVADSTGCQLTDSATVVDSCTAGCPLPTSLWSQNVQDVSAILKWIPVCGASGYQLQYKVAGTSTWTTVWKYNNIGHKNITGLSPSTTYKYRINTLCGNTSSGWSGMHTFYTLAAPCSVPSGTLANPVGLNQAKLQWTAVAGAVSYTIRWREAGGSWASLNKGGNAVHHWLTGLTPGSTYQWQIRAACQYGNVLGTSWSSLNTIVTPSNKWELSDEAEALLQGEAASMELFPNPARSEVWVQFTGLAAHDNTQLMVLDATGRLVHQQPIAGNGVTRLHLYQQLPPGAYLVRGQAGNRSFTKRLMIVR